MKMKYSIIFIVVLFVQSCSNEKIENDWKKENLKGNVKSYSEFSYKAKNRFGKIVKGKRKMLYSQKKYDDKGNTIEKNQYNSDGSLHHKWINKYDKKGNKIEENAYNSDGSLKSKSTYKYDFDKKGNWVKKIDFEDEIPESLLEREYEYYK